METDTEMAEHEANGATGAPDELLDTASARTGEFAQSMLLELRAMARKSGCVYLAYLLEMSLIEASDLAAGRAPSAVASTEVATVHLPDLATLLHRIASERV